MTAREENRDRGGHNAQGDASGFVDEISAGAAYFAGAWPGPMEAPSPEDEVANAEVLRLLEEALSEQQRAVLALDLDGHTAEESACCLPRTFTTDLSPSVTGLG